MSTPITPGERAAMRERYAAEAEVARLCGPHPKENR